MADPIINDKPVPDKLKNSGQYRYFGSYSEARNGMGLLIQTGLPRIEWTWAHVTKPDFILLLEMGGFEAGGGNENLYSASMSGATQLWHDRLDALVSYSGGVLDRPVYESYQSSIFMNVTLRVSQLK